MIKLTPFNLNVNINKRKSLHICGYKLPINVQNFMQKDSAQAKISSKVAGGGYFFDSLCTCVCRRWRVWWCAGSVWYCWGSHCLSERSRQLQLYLSTGIPLWRKDMCRSVESSYSPFSQASTVKEMKRWFKKLYMAESVLLKPQCFSCNSQFVCLLCWRRHWWMRHRRNSTVLQPAWYL